MAYDLKLADRVKHILGKERNVTGKKMFGGMAFLLNGNLLVCVRKDSLLVRLGPEQGAAALEEEHVEPFLIKGRGSMKGWVVVGLDGVDTDQDLNRWIGLAVEFVRTLPVK